MQVRAKTPVGAEILKRVIYAACIERPPSEVKRNAKALRRVIRRMEEES